MRDIFSENFDWLWRIALAQSFNIILFFLSLINFSLPLSGEVRPHFLIMMIYFWTIHRPTLMSPFFVFVLGLFYDLFLGYPVGFHSVVFLAVQWVLKTQRLFFMGQTYLVQWIGFFISCLACFMIEWLFFSLFSAKILGFSYVLGSLFMSTFLFPFISLVFIGLHRLLLSGSRRGY
jgi:rod shape-determining protein MreD